MKTRIITSIFGLALLAVVLCLFNTPVFEIVVALICLIAVHEIYEAFDLGKRGPWVFGGFSVYTVLLILSADLGVLYYLETEDKLYALVRQPIFLFLSALFVIVPVAVLRAAKRVLRK